MKRETSASGEILSVLLCLGLGSPREKEQKYNLSTTSFSNKMPV